MKDIFFLTLTQSLADKYRLTPKILSVRDINLDRICIRSRYIFPSMMKDHFFLIPRTEPLLSYILPLTQLNNDKEKEEVGEQAVAKKKKEE